MDDIRPLKDLAEIKGGFPLGFFIMLLLIVVGVAVAFIYFKKKRHSTEETVAPPRPPEEIAMEAFRSLQGMGLVQKGMVKEYYIKLSDIIRIYIEGRYGVFALDRTTWELYQEMRLRKIERAHVDKIRDFLEDCDLVKFAKYIPTEKEIEEAYERAEGIIAEPAWNVTLNHVEAK